MNVESQPSCWTWLRATSRLTRAALRVMNPQPSNGVCSSRADGVTSSKVPSTAMLPGTRFR